MIQKIKTLILLNRAEEALRLIDRELSSKHFMAKEESFYSDLLSLRVAANALLGRQDEILQFVTWKERNPVTRDIYFDDRHKVSLQDSSILLFSCDAYINTIHKDKYFDYGCESSSGELLKKLGKDEVDCQIGNIKNIKDRPFIILEHHNLPAPISYHIPAITGEDNEIDGEALRLGLNEVLKDIEKRGLKKIASFALTMEVLRPRDEKEKTAGVIAECLNEFFKRPVKTLPEIYFLFVSYNSFSIFENVFTSFTKMGRYLAGQKERLQAVQTELIKAVNTTDTKYIETLKNISYSVDEESTVLLLGESGTGKSFLAKKIHENSKRRDHKFASLNCAVVTPEQLFTLVFGWGKNVFRGSSEGGISIMESADKGTIFFDEIGYADLFFQTSLLKFLDDKTYKKVGDQTEYSSDVRIIFGTNQDLENLVRKGLFRHDLYERIASERKFELIPLRQRPGDIGNFVEGFLMDYNEKNNCSILLQTEALELLKSYKWYGNVRQLKHYLGSLLNNSRYENKFLITKSEILKNEPRNYRLAPENGLSSDFEELENLLCRLLSSWGSSPEYTFVDDFLSAIVSKLYLEDLKDKYIKIDSSKIIGIAGSGGKQSTLDKRYKMYDEVKQYFLTKVEPKQNL